jgi:hypothetical protein
MDIDLLEALFFQRCADANGSTQSLQVGRRNGRPSVFLARGICYLPELDARPTAFIDQERFFVNLNRVERETWRKILQAQSIASIARQEGVSRAAIYARIEGNRRGHGGMIRKNFWVLLWWRLRQKTSAGAR